MARYAIGIFTAAGGSCAEGPSRTNELGVTHFAVVVNAQDAFLRGFTGEEQLLLESLERVGFGRHPGRTTLIATARSRSLSKAL